MRVLFVEDSPGSMDQVNDDAMAEAFKDLVAMADGLTKQ